MNDLVGRKREMKLLQQVLESPRSEFVAVYGRRRVGKTFLINEFFENQFAFKQTGQHKLPVKKQLENFALAYAQARNEGIGLPPRDWRQAFHSLTQHLESLPPPKHGKHIIFFDELPWLASPKSEFLPSLEYFWNTWASVRNDIVLVVCGSAASWMIHKLLRNRGGLYNRITRRLRLLPFSLGETELYLKNSRIDLTRRQIVEVNLLTGGIPQYLNHVERGQSSAQIIESLAFENDAPLRDEFYGLFASLFAHSERHCDVIRFLANRRYGYTRNEMVQNLDITSGGGFTTLLDELEQSGFIRGSYQFGSREEKFYRLTDEYSLFFLRWIEPLKDQTHISWKARQQSREWSAWSGFAFETLCWKHIDQIRRSLGISGMETVENPWLYQPADSTEEGAQIDLVIDRKDDCINLCEMKFTRDPFVIDKQTASNLRKKREIFTRVTGCKKAVFLTMIHSAGLKDNALSRELVTHQVNSDDLFATE